MEMKFWQGCLKLFLHSLESICITNTQTGRALWHNMRTHFNLIANKKWSSMRCIFGDDVPFKSLFSWIFLWFIGCAVQSIKPHSARAVEEGRRVSLLLFRNSGEVGKTWMTVIPH